MPSMRSARDDSWWKQAPLTLPPPHDADQTRRQRGRQVLGSTVTLDRSEYHASHREHDVVGRNRCRERPQAHVTDEKSRRRDLRRPRSKRALDGAVETAGNEERARFEIDRTQREPNQHGEEHEPGSSGAERLFCRAAREERYPADLHERQSRGSARRDEREQVRGQDGPQRVLSAR